MAATAAAAVGVLATVGAGLYTAYWMCNASRVHETVPVVDNNNEPEEDSNDQSDESDEESDDQSDESDDEAMEDCEDDLDDSFWYENGTIKSVTECMCIGSYGDQQPSGIEVAKKRALINTREKATAYLPGVKADLDRFEELVDGDPDKYMYEVLEDKPGSQQPRNFYFKKIAEFLEQCTEQGAMIYYSGHGTRCKGDWVFADDCITFDTIYDLYVEHFEGKLLYIVTDACYSGMWARRLAEKLEKQRIGACGHLAKEEGILIKVIAACGPYEHAWDGVFSELGMEADNSGSIVFNRDDKIKSGIHKQTTCSLDSTNIRCFEKPDLTCKFEQIPNTVTWNWKDLSSLQKKKRIAGHVRLWTGRDRHTRRYNWQKVLVREETDGSNLHDYIICSG